MTDTHLAILLDRLMRRVHVELHAAAPQFDTERIGPGGSMILLTLDELGEVPMQRLSRSLSRDKSQMTRAVASLERKDLVRRGQSLSDSRVTLVTLTPKGRETVLRLQDAIAEALDQVLQPLASAEKTHLLALLDAAVGSDAQKAD